MNDHINFPIKILLYHNCFDHKYKSLWLHIEQIVILFSFRDLCKFEFANCCSVLHRTLIVLVT